MERVEMEKIITDKIVENIKIYYPEENGQDILINILVSLDKGASNENLKDMIGFIRFSEKNKKSLPYITGNLMHDINGLADMDPCFLPRTTGYDTV